VEKKKKKKNKVKDQHPIFFDYGSMVIKKGHQPDEKSTPIQ
jgi:hypothetical protein